METTNQQDTKIHLQRNDPQDSSLRFRQWERIAMAIIASGLATLLGIAASLNPDPSGMGTHQQLGLPPCSSLVFFGIPCPACGMTTSWALLLDGRPIEAIYTNTGGVLLAMAAIGTSLTFVTFAWQGKRSQRVWFSSALLGVLCAALIAAFIQWGVRMLT